MDKATVCSSTKICYQIPQEEVVNVSEAFNISKALTNFDMIKENCI